MAEAAPAVAPRELVLDRYRPLRPLGTGGSGLVWLARDEQTGLDVALKVVARDGKAGHRAEREAAGDVWAVGVLLWEALAGFHPFWTSSPLETARAIEGGAPPLASARPELPRMLLAAVDGALAPDPARRPSAAALARTLRGALEERARRRAAPRYRLARPRVESCLAPALAGLLAGWSAATLPFYPGGWWIGLALLAALLTALRPRIGLAFALAVPLFPIGNVSLGLALLWAGLALGWLALPARGP